MVTPTQRVLILGNSGSGKSTLAARMAEEHGLAHLDLDVHAWKPTTPPERVALEDAGQALRAFTSEHDAWVAEGCYADLIELLVPQATALVFLDLPVEQCLQNARARPWEPHKYPSEEAQQENLEMLLRWIEAYPERDGPLGRAAHLALFDAFPRRKEARTSQA